MILIAALRHVERRKILDTVFFEYFSPKIRLENLDVNVVLV